MASPPALLATRAPAIVRPISSDLAVGWLNFLSVS